MRSVFKPSDLGFDYAKPEEVVGGATEDEAKQIFDNVLANKALPAQKNIVLANAALRHSGSGEGTEGRQRVYRHCTREHRQRKSSGDIQEVRRTQLVVFNS